MKENLITLRSLRWPDDRAALLALDASFTTDRVFRLERTNNCVTLEEVGVEPPLLKAYPLAIETWGLGEFRQGSTSSVLLRSA